MTNIIGIPVSQEDVKQYKEARNKYDSIDSYSVVSKLHHTKMNQGPIISDIKIIFENDNNETTKACCNEKCFIF